MGEQGVARDSAAEAQDVASGEPDQQCDLIQQTEPVGAFGMEKTIDDFGERDQGDGQQRKQKTDWLDGKQHADREKQTERNIEQNENPVGRQTELVVFVHG